MYLLFAKSENATCLRIAFTNHFPFNSLRYIIEIQYQNILFVNDRPGILADVTKRIARKGMSLEDVSTSIRLSAAGKREFVIDVLASSPNIKDKENIDQYVADISSMEQDLRLSHMDIRVHTA